MEVFVFNILNAWPNGKRQSGEEFQIREWKWIPYRGANAYEKPVNSSLYQKYGQVSTE
jgi:hypothetical protein